ncbi:hypothetical protein Glove_396g68 [Diversispora epigaea]|uniref:Uncharacterized protein n=1 Tax=Diversispora epigaea TaxID=1348612 RepID=A0A397H5X8_9GLOM|nr:hypothetical protein Glove_396g68 [Diversispora epigaea]
MIQIKDISSGLKPYWNEFTKEISQRLLLPTKTSSVTVDLNSLNSSSRKLTQNSWFSVKALKSEKQQENLQMIYFVAKKNRLYLAKNRRKCKEKKQKMTNKKEEKKPAGKTKKNKTLSNSKTERNFDKMVLNSKVEVLSAIGNEGISQNKKALRAKCLIN